MKNIRTQGLDCSMFITREFPFTREYKYLAIYVAMNTVGLIGVKV